jgi:DNA repair protein RadA
MVEVKGEGWLTPISQMKSLSKRDISILEQNGIKTVEGLIYRGDELEEIFDAYEQTLRIKKINNIRMEALTLKKRWMIPASEWATVEAQQLIFKTGSTALDQMLGGGVHSMYVAEFFGEFGTGKSQILDTIMVLALNELAERTAIYIDCEGTYRDDRIRQIAKLRGFDPESITKRVVLLKPETSEDLLEIVKRLYLTIEARKTALIVCDSLISHLRAEYYGREMLQPRQQMLLRILDRLKRLASLYNIGVVVSNQVVAVPTQTFSPFGDLRATGGHIIAHNTEPRVFVRKAGASPSVRIARIEDSCWLPPAEARFRITEKGVEDIGKEEEEEHGEAEH